MSELNDDKTEVSAWKNTNETTISELLLRSKGCLNLYNNLNKGMGSFFFFFMSFNQIAIIFYLFMTITTLLDGKYDIPSLCFGMCFGLGTLGLAISVVSVTLALERYSAKRDRTKVSFLAPKLRRVALYLPQVLPRSGTVGRRAESDVDQLQGEG